MAVILIVYLLLYLLSTLPLVGIFRKAGIPPLFAFIPVFNFIVWLRLVHRPVWWIIFLLWWVTTLGLVAVLAVDTLRRFNQHRFYQQMGASMLGFIYYSILGFSKRKMVEEDKLIKVKTGRYISIAACTILFLIVIRTFIVGFYTIPTPSNEKTIMVGDYIAVNKWIGGARIPITPISFTFQGNTFPVLGMKSYIDQIQLPYLRLPAFRAIKNNDYILFNWPADQNLPVDRKEPYIKRCVGIPGDTIEIREAEVYINGRKNKDFPGIQLDYFVNTDGSPINEKTLSDLGIDEPMPTNVPGQFFFWLTPEQVAEVGKLKNITSIIPNIRKKNQSSAMGEVLFPGDTKNFPFNIDNFGPIVIPKKDVIISLSPNNLALYHRLITEYEKHVIDLTAEGRITIDGIETDQYKPAMDYYWMMGDSRHNSLDSRYWGFVPEDHIVGKATRIYASYDKVTGRTRWERFFKKIE